MAQSKEFASRLKHLMKEGGLTREQAVQVMLAEEKDKGAISTDGLTRLIVLIVATSTILGVLAAIFGLDWLIQVAFYIFLPIMGFMVILGILKWAVLPALWNGEIADRAQEYLEEFKRELEEENRSADKTA